MNIIAVVFKLQVKCSALMSGVAIGLRRFRQCFGDLGTKCRISYCELCGEHDRLDEHGTSGPPRHVIKLLGCYGTTD